VGAVPRRPDGAPGRRCRPPAPAGHTCSSGACGPFGRGRHRPFGRGWKCHVTNPRWACRARL